MKLKFLDDSTESTAFNNPFVIIFTGDQQTADDIIDALGTILPGIDADHVNIFPLDKDVVNFWDQSVNSSIYYSEPDILTLLHRISGPLVKADFDAYNKLAMPAALYRFKDKSQRVPRKPLQTPVTPRESDTFTSEPKVYQNSFDTLAQNVIKDYTEKGYAYIGHIENNETTLGMYDDWDTIFKNEISSFILPTRDATYGAIILLVKSYVSNIV